MFRQRQKPTFQERIRGYVWPRTGWKRTFRYILARLSRIPDSSQSIAAGFACGAAMSFTPFVGVHFILSAALAWLLRVNILSAVIGTVVGNPWTFPFIWVWIYELGRMIGVGSGPDEAHSMDFSGFFGGLMEAALRMDVGFMLETAAPIFWPMFVGSLPTAVAAWFAFYFLLKPVVVTYKKRRERRRLRKMADKVETP